jgi:hypothetical protein
VSRGNTVLQVRVPDLLLAQIERQIASRNYHTNREPWVISDWIRVAMIEKLRKMERCRAPRGSRKRRPGRQPADQPGVGRPESP